MIKLILFLALAYLFYRLLRSLGGRASHEPLVNRGAPATPPIDRSRVVDAEYREAEARSDGVGETESGPGEAP